LPLRISCFRPLRAARGGRRRGGGRGIPFDFLPPVDTIFGEKWQFARFYVPLGHKTGLLSRYFLKTFVIVFGVFHILPLHKRGKILAIAGKILIFDYANSWAYKQPLHIIAQNDFFVNQLIAYNLCSFAHFYDFI